MHYFGAIVVPPDVAREDVEPHIDVAMAPHQERYDESDDTASGFWDWWQVGGRWTGVWSEYDPARDPVNTETCSLCGGTGTRSGGVEQFGEEWAKGCNGCNGCKGEGVRTKWPTNWAAFDGDIIRVSALLNNPIRRPHTIVLPDGTAAQKETWNGKEFVEDPEWDETVLKLLDPYRDQALVVVDYHC